MHYSVFIDTIKVLHCPCNLTIDNNLVYLIRIISRTNYKRRNQASPENAIDGNNRRNCDYIIYIIKHEVFNCKPSLIASSSTSEAAEPSGLSNKWRDFHPPFSRNRASQSPITRLFVLNSFDTILTFKCFLGIIIYTLNLTPKVYFLLWQFRLILIASRLFNKLDHTIQH